MVLVSSDISSSRVLAAGPFFFSSPGATYNQFYGHYKNPFDCVVVSLSLCVGLASQEQTRRPVRFIDFYNKTSPVPLPPYIIEVTYCPAEISKIGLLLLPLRPFVRCNG